MSHHRLHLVLLAALLAAALPSVPAAPATPPAAEKSADRAPHYPMRGTVVGVFPEKSALLVKNDAIPGILDAGTMAFRVEDPAVFKHAKKGQLIAATVIVREDDFYLTEIQLSKR
jgi:protein SCO1/2